MQILIREQNIMNLVNNFVWKGLTNPSIKELNQPLRTKVHSFLEHSYPILVSLKIVVIFEITSADFILISADVVLKMTTILKEMRIAQLCSKSEQTLCGLLYQRTFRELLNTWAWNSLTQVTLIHTATHKQVCSSLLDARNFTRSIGPPLLKFGEPVLFSKYDLFSQNLPNFVWKGQYEGHFGVFKAPYFL